MLGVYSTAEHIEFSKDGDYLYSKAFQLVDDYKNDQLIGYSTNIMIIKLTLVNVSIV